MRNTSPPEERFPLLLLFLEDGQRSSKETKRIFFEKGRYHGIASGVTTVITQWPGHLTACLTTALFIGLVIILFSMLMLMLSLGPANSFLTTRCRKHLYNQNNNTSTIVHLVHGPQLWTLTQLNTLEKIVEKYGSSNIDLILIQNELDINNTAVSNNITTIRAVTTEGSANFTKGNTRKLLQIPKYSRKTRNISLPWDNFGLNLNIGTGLLKMLLESGNIIKRNSNTTQNPISTKALPKQVQSITELLQKYPAIHIQNDTYSEIFKQSPLFFSWQSLNEFTRIFAIRVLQVWNYGGITFDLSEVYDPPYSMIFKNTLKLGKNKNVIYTGLPFFHNLPEGLVTVDEKGLHMETKTICHAFFGEILMKLRKAKNDTMPKTLIQDTLKSFCRRGAVDANYCRKIVV